MSPCPRLEELTSHHAGHVDAAARLRIDLHLDECPACRQLLQRIETPTQVIRVASGDSVSPPILENPPESSIPGAEDLRFPGPITPEAPLGQLLGYAIVQKLGWGGGGLVYLARDARLQREVALKFLRQDLVSSPRERARFEREARALASVRHENIVEVHDICFPEFFPPFLVLEYVGGDTLAQRLERDGTWPARKAAVLVRNIARALEVAHDQGLVHRDIKPGNILFDSDDVPKLIDFGLARPVNEAGDLTQSGVVLGTPAYMSPEQILAPNEVDGRSDVYSLGIVLYELVTGYVPFRGMPHMILAQIEHDDPTPPRRFNDAIPRDLETIILKALHKDRGKRYASAARMAEDLNRWLHGAPILARPLGPVRRATRWMARHPGPTGLAVILAGFVAIWLMGQRHSYGELKQAHADTKKAFALAQEQRDIALDTLLALVFEAQDQLQEETGHDALRLALLHKALEGLQKISRTSENADLIDQGTITAHQRLGDVHLAMHQPREAMAEFGAAYALAERLLLLRPDSEAVRRALLMACYRQGDAALTLGNPDVASVHYDKARRQGIEAGKHHPGAHWLHQGLALIHERLGNGALESDAPAEALAHFAAALKEWEAAPPESPLPAAWVQVHMAQAYQRHSEPVRAEEWAKRGRAEIRDWAGAHPEDREARRHWALAEKHWADLQLQRNDTVAARASLEKADQILAELLSSRPNTLALRRDRAQVRAQLGRLLQRADQTSAARAHLVASWQIWNDLAQRASVSVADWKELVLVEKSLLSLDAESGSKDQARQWLQKAQRRIQQGRQRFGEQHPVNLWIDMQTVELEALRRKIEG